MVTQTLNSWVKTPELSEFTISVPSEVSNWMLLLEDKTVLPTEPLFWNCELPNYILSFQSELRSILIDGVGMIRIQLESNLNDDEFRYIYACISALIGTLNDRYGFFFDVVDHGLDYTKAAIPVSKTNAETGYHTDSTAKNYFPDVVGLLCLQPAHSGGDSLIVNACNLYESILSEQPNWKTLLHEPLFRDVITPGTAQSKEQIKENAFPLFEWRKDSIVFRYMRYWIESAYKKLNEKLPNELNNVLDYIDTHFSNPNHVLQFRMERGDILYVNNHFLCHNRTGFVDGNEPRRLVRTWVNI